MYIELQQCYYNSQFYRARGKVYALFTIVSWWSGGKLFRNDTFHQLFSAWGIVHLIVQGKHDKYYLQHMYYFIGGQRLTVSISKKYKIRKVFIL